MVNHAFKVEETTISDIQKAYETRRLTSVVSDRE